MRVFSATFRVFVLLVFVFLHFLGVVLYFICVAIRSLGLRFDVECLLTRNRSVLISTFWFILGNENLILRVICHIYDVS